MSQQDGGPLISDFNNSLIEEEKEPLVIKDLVKIKLQHLQQSQKYKANPSTKM